MTEQTEQDMPLACSLSARELQTRVDENEGILRGAEQVKEQEHGYAWKFSGEAVEPQKLLQFITQERACCPFFTFDLHFEPQNGPVWLSVSGPTGTKEFIQELMGTRA